MSINTLREALKDIPGAHEMTMNYRYIDGVSHEQFNIGMCHTIVKSPATPEAIREGFASIGLT